MAAPGVVEICATAGVVPLLASEPGVAASRVRRDWAPTREAPRDVGPP